MTNAEKLSKNTSRLSEIMVDSAKDGCRQCSLHGPGVCSMCHSPLEIEGWLEREVKKMEVIKVNRAEYDKIVRGEAVEKDGKIIQFDPVGEVHKPTKEQIKEALDEIIDYCVNSRCSECPFHDEFVGGYCILGKPYYTWDTEQIAEEIADETDRR